MTRKEYVAINRRIQQALEDLDGACKCCRKQYHEMSKQEAREHLEREGQ